MNFNTKAGSRLFLWLWLGLLAGSGACHSQTPDATTKFRLAGALEQAGDNDHALQIYRDLSAKDPSNPMFGDALQHLLVQLKKYDEALELVTQRLQRTPRDPSLLTTLGTIAYRAGREKDAAAAWDRVIALDPSNQGLYRILASALIENRLLDRAAETYRRGRNAIGDRTLFTLELAQLFAATMDYASASSELVRWLEQNPAQTAYIQSRLGLLLTKPEARKAAVEVVRRSFGGVIDAQLYELLEWLYMEDHEYDLAYEVALKRDAMSGSKGTALLSFAERAAGDKGYNAAVRSYGEALKCPLTDQNRAVAMYGYASALKEAAHDADSSQFISFLPSSRVLESRRSDAAVDAFRALIVAYPASAPSARAWYQIGVLLMERGIDLNGAREAFEAARKSPAGSPALKFDATLRLGSVAETRGDSTVARQWFTTVAAAPDATPNQGDEAGYRVAELEYFAGRFDEAMRLLDAMSLNPKADFANDAIALHAFLQENIGTKDALMAFARADFTARQGHNTEAIAAFQDIMRRFAGTLLVDDAMMRCADLQARSGLFNNAIATYSLLLDTYKEGSVFLDKAQFRLGQIYEQGIGDGKAAVAAYGQLLSAYPQSLLVEETRKRIRALRGESQ